MANALTLVYVDLAERVGRRALSAPWRTVLEACDDPQARELCLELSPPPTSVDSVLLSRHAQERFEGWPPRSRTQVTDALGRAFTRARPQAWSPEALEMVEPPSSWTKLIEWIGEHGLERLESQPLSELQPFVKSGGAYDWRAETILLRHAAGTIGALLRGRGDRRLRTTSVQRALRGYLAYALARRELAARRRERWSGPLEDPLAELADALRALRGPADDADDAPPPRPVFPEGTKLWVDEEAEAMTADVPTRWGGTCEVELSLFERRGAAPAVRCELGGIDQRAWERALAEWWLDILYDPEHPLHGPLREIASRPRWPRLLAELGQLVAEADTKREEPEERLIWRVGLVGVGLTVHPALQRRGKRGWSRGRRIGPQDVAARSDLNPLDERVVQGLQRGNDGLALEALVGHPRVVLEDEPKQALRVRATHAELELTGEGERRLRLRLAGRAMEPAEALNLLVGHVLPHLDVERGTLDLAVLPETMVSVLRSLARKPASFPREADEPLMAILTKLPPGVGLRLPEELAGEPVPPRSELHLALSLHGDGQLEVRLQVSPLGDGQRFPPGVGPVHLVGREGGARRSTRRDLTAEAATAERWTEALRLNEARALASDRFLIAETELALDLLERAREAGSALVLEWPAGKSLRVAGPLASLRVQTRSAEDWFVLAGNARIDEAQVELAAIRRAVERQQRYVRVGDGLFARISDELRAQIGALADVSSMEGGENPGASRGDRHRRADTG